jgi:hypothetical protein
MMEEDLHGGGSAARDEQASAEADREPQEPQEPQKMPYVVVQQAVPSFSFRYLNLV